MLDLAPESSPSVQALLAGSRDRVKHTVTSRELVAESVVGGLFLIASLAVAIGFDSGRDLSLPSALMVFVTLAVASRVVFEVGSCYSYPTQVAFVPGLFLLPPELLPLLLATALAVGKLSEVPSGLPPARCLMALGDASYSLGPVLIMLLAGSPTAATISVAVLALALGSQFAVETLASRLREWLHGGATFREQLLEGTWIYSVDVLFSAVGFALALAAGVEPAAVLLALPLFTVLHFLARDRTSRMSSVLELSEAYRGTAHLLSNVIGHDDLYTGVHTRQVADLASQVATRLNVTPSQHRNVEFGALLHDVGKIAISNEIINKPGPLSTTEWQTIKAHTLEGQRMLDQIGGLMSDIGRVVRSAHERYDGEGYPDGLRGEEIPIESRIVFCCDAFNAMTTDRCYRPSMSEGLAIEEVRRCSGSQFDPVVVEALIASLGASPARVGVGAERKDEREQGQDREGGSPRKLDERSSPLKSAEQMPTLNA